MFIFVMILYLIIVFLGIVPLYRNNKKRELVIYSILSGVGLVLTLFIILDIKVPSPSSLIQKLVLILIGGSGER